MNAVTVTEAVVRDLRVTVAQVPSAVTTAGTLEVDAGYAADPVGAAGLAHLTEHVRVAVAARGGLRVTGRTDAYITHFASGSQDLAVLTEALVAVLDPRVHDEIVHAAEQKSVQVEMVRRDDNPRLRIAPVAAAAALPGSTHAVHDRSTTDSISALTLEQVMTFSAAAYRPATARLCLVSRHDADSVLDRIDSRLARRVSTAQPEARPRIEPAASAEANAPNLCAQPALVLVAEAANAPEQCGLLAREIAFDLLFSAGGAVDEAAASAGLKNLGFSELTGPDSAAAVVAWHPIAEPDRSRLVAEALERLDTHMRDGDRIRRSRQRLRSQIAFDLTSVSGLTRRLTRYAAGTGPWPDSDAFISVADGSVAEQVEKTMGTASTWVLTGDCAERVR